MVGCHHANFSCILFVNWAGTARSSVVIDFAPVLSRYPAFLTQASWNPVSWVWAGVLLSGQFAFYYRCLTETLRDTEGGVGVDGRSHWKS